MASYKFSSSILAKFDKDSSLNSYVLQKAAVDLAFINDYENSIQIWDMQNIPPRKIKDTDIGYFKQFIKTDARNYILEKALNEQIVIINEAHHHPEHRIFAESLLEGLYSAGYRYFGVEGLNNYDSLLNERKYPIYGSGFLIQQPQFGNLIRRALELGFVLFPYDSEETSSIQREKDQANNIKSFWLDNNKPKMIVYCGFQHVEEGSHFYWEKAMAGRLAEYTGVNPFTIDQVTLTEHSDTIFDDPIYKIIDSDYPAVFLDSCDWAYKGPAVNNQCDLYVYHPRTQWKLGRPIWMFQNSRIPYIVNIPPGLSFPCLVFAYNRSEAVDRAIPIDVIEMKNSHDGKALSLKKGNYTILFKDSMGITLHKDIDL